MAFSEIGEITEDTEKTGVIPQNCMIPSKIGTLSPSSLSKGKDKVPPSLLPHSPPRGGGQVGGIGDREMCGGDSPERFIGTQLDL